MARKIPKRGKDLGVQIAWMQRFFPRFEYRWGSGIWFGTLRPRDSSPEYVVRVAARMESTPVVHILEPEIITAPHRYSDRSLCLFYPQDRSWSASSIIALTIVPWTAEWLWLYECWCDTGEWFGDEAPHSGEKHRPK